MSNKYVCSTERCTRCGACLAVCPKDAISFERKVDCNAAIIDSDKCINCGLCRGVCQNHNEIELLSPVQWKQGWSADGMKRNRGSSGGIATTIIENFILAGGYACSCVFKDGNFIFDIVNKPEDVESFTGSKYVKSDPTLVYEPIKKLLESNEKVLFVGLPCQVAAVKVYVGKELQKELYTVDLICHGTPSKEMLDIFLKQYNIRINGVQTIAFRIKNKMQLVINDKGIICKGVTDYYTTSFLKGLNYTCNCYSCHYAKTNRISDLTIGDSWGSSLPETEKIKGISLMIAQTKKGLSLINGKDIILNDVDIEESLKNNQQLIHPMCAPSVRSAFFKGLDAGKKYNSLIWKLYPIDCFKQYVKEILINLKVVK